MFVYKDFKFGALNGALGFRASELRVLWCIVKCQRDEKVCVQLVWVWDSGWRL